MPENMMTLQRRRPLRIYAEAFARTKPLPTNAHEYAVSLEEFGESLVSGYQKLLDTSEKLMLEMQNISLRPIIMRREDVPFG